MGETHKDSPPPNPSPNRADILMEEDRVQLAIPTDGISVKRTEQGSGLSRRVLAKGHLS